MINIIFAQYLHHSFRLRISVPGKQPPRRLRQQRHQRHNDNNIYQLNTQREPPLRLRCGTTERERDDITNHKPENIDHHLLDHGLALGTMMTGLHMPHGRRGSVSPIANPRNEPAPKQMLHVMRRRLQQDARRHDDGKIHQHALPPQPLPDKQRQHRASETAQVVHAGDEPGQAGAGVVEILNELVTYNDTTENALLVAEEAHDRAGGDGDGGVRGVDVPWGEGKVGAPSDGDAGSSAGAAVVVEFRRAGGFAGQETVEGGDA